ncbi:hypothetical protein H0H92_008770, partial [Tricholoma furcatifolium]
FLILAYPTLPLKMNLKMIWTFLVISSQQSKISMNIIRPIMHRNPCLNPNHRHLRKLFWLPTHHLRKALCLGFDVDHVALMNSWSFGPCRKRTLRPVIHCNGGGA